MPSAAAQWWVLSARGTRALARDGEVFVILVAPVVFALGFYVPLRSTMALAGIDYAQYVMPVIALQAVSFTAIAAALRAARETRAGFTSRLRTMPVCAAAPVAARVTVALVRASASLLVAVGVGHLIGFRFEHGPGWAAAWFGLCLLIALVLVLGADALGTLSTEPDTIRQLLTLPQLLLGMMSTGYMPVAGFPDWIQPFVRDQPISQFLETLRGLSTAGAPSLPIGATLVWLGAVAAVSISLAVYARHREQPVRRSRSGRIEPEREPDAPNQVPAPATRGETSLIGLAEQTVPLAIRVVRHWSRNPKALVQSLCYPALVLIMFWLLLDRALAVLRGRDSVTALVPMAVLMGAMLGALSGGHLLLHDRESGWLARLWTLPIHRQAGLTGQCAAETLRIAATTVLLTALGTAIGFRFTNGLFAAIVALLVPLLFGLGFVALVSALALHLGSSAAIETLSLLTTALTLFSTGFVPLAAFPESIHLFVQYQPVSCAVDALRGLTVGGPVALPLLATVLWSAGLFLLCGRAAVSAYTARE